jgi:hypothetical protein
MKTVKLILVIAAMCLGAGLSTSIVGQSTVSNRFSPKALVADLYREHDRKRGPFFQTRNRALLYKYFEKSLADLIWKDAVNSKGEVGVIDGDPLYDAQDMEIKKFAIAKAVYDSGKARVSVTFENFAKPKKIIFILGNGRSGWRINDIDYGEEGTLRGWFKEGGANKQDHNFEGLYRVGDVTCTVKPIKMAFEVRWAKGKGTTIFFYDTASEQSGGKKIFNSEDKGKGKDQFVFDDDSYQSGKFVRADGKELSVTKIR